MHRLRLLFFFIFILITHDLFSLEGLGTSSIDSSRLMKKTIQALRITSPPKIDGYLDESFWNHCPVADQFVVYSPGSGSEPRFPSEVRFAYDDIALYISAILYDDHPDSICQELGRRDQVEQLNTDYISFDILPYNDQLNMYEFKITPANLQNDCKYTAVGVDINWNAVWESGARVFDSGWMAEIKIPWSALRFPQVDKQVWGINMWRNLHRKQEFSTWSFVSNQTDDIFKYYGTVSGIDSIQPPLRLSLSPFLSSYLNKEPTQANWSYLFRGGLDLRWGINESYTLDMMLIPDFGQVQSDDKILNLTPFEVRYDEKRQFFTEATELFNKCETFYSRRVGAQPDHFYAAYDPVKMHEVVSNNPEETRIINATKISGRNAKGLGLGYFNAMTTNTKATILDTLTGNKREVMTQPFTNYNVLVVDQNLKNQSYITLINTNYTVPGEGRSDNVTGFEGRLANKKSTLAVFGRAIVSQLFTDGFSPQYGHRFLISVSKPSGKIQYELARDQMDQYYNPNAMGFLTNNNQVSNSARISYNIFDPWWKILQSRTNFTVSYNHLYSTGQLINLRTMLNSTTTFLNFWSISFIEGSNSLGYNDYYEPRVWGWVYKRPFSYNFQTILSTDRRKTFKIEVAAGFMNSPSNNYFYYLFEVTPRIRFSDRFAIALDCAFSKDLNDYGWVSTVNPETVDPSIYFGRRDVTTVANVLTSKYTLSTKASINLRVRHYWSRADYFDYLILERSGYLLSSTYNENHDINYNAFTADLQFIWEFAPGSEMTVMWKNDINPIPNQFVKVGYFENLQNTFDSPQSNSFSIKVLYYLDWMYLKKLGKKRA